METGTTGVFAYPKGKALLLRGSSCNVFAVSQPDGGFILIDTGVSVGGKARRIKRALLRDGLDLKDMKAILLTHAHPDHINGLPVLLEEAPQCEVWIHKREESPLKTPAIMWDFEKGIADVRGEFLPFGAMGLVRRVATFGMGASVGTRADHLFEDGTTIGSGDGALKVIHTPGHTVGHSCFYLASKRLLFLGDLFDPTFNHRPSVNLPTCDFTDTIASHKRVKELDIEMLATAHGDEVQIVISGRDEVARAIDQAIAHLETSYKNVSEFLEANKNVRLQDFQKCIPSDIWKAKFERVVVAWAILQDLTRAHKVRREGRTFSWRA